MEEKTILAQIQHPFTCKLVKAFQDSMFVYLLMEYIQGGELFSLLHSDEHHDKGFPDAQAKFYAFCLADVFAYIHRSKIVFRDLVSQRCHTLRPSSCTDGSLNNLPPR